MDVVKLSELRFELLPYLSCSPSVVPKRLLPVRRSRKNAHGKEIQLK